MGNREFEDVRELLNALSPYISARALARIVGMSESQIAENGRYPPTQNGDIRSLFMLFALMAMQN